MLLGQIRGGGGDFPFVRSKPNQDLIAGGSEDFDGVARAEGDRPILAGHRACLHDFRFIAILSRVFGCAGIGRGRAARLMGKDWSCGQRR